MAGYATNPDNRLHRDGVYEYAYDDEGNRTKRITLVGGLPTGATTFYDWDHRNHLAKVTERTGPNVTDTVTKTVEYEYDMYNRLTKKVLDLDGPGGAQPITDHFLWDGAQIVQVFSDMPGRTHWYVYGPNPDQVIFDQTTVTYALLGDHLGTIRDIVDTAGANVNHVVYEAFGKRVSETAGAPFSPLFGFSGRPLDSDTGLQNNHNRWYDPRVGRWLSNDPIGFAAGDVNLQRYVNNGPTNAVDPSGLAANDHHWFPTRKPLMDDLISKCGAIFEALEWSMEQFHNLFTTSFGGWGRGTVHDWIEYRNPRGGYASLVKRVYDESKDCCDLLKRMKDLIIKVSGDVIDEFGIPGASSGSLPELHKYRDKLLRETGQVLDMFIDAVCNPDPYRPRMPVPREFWTIIEPRLDTPESITNMIFNPNSHEYQWRVEQHRQEEEKKENDRNTTITIILIGAAAAGVAAGGSVGGPLIYPATQLPRILPFVLPSAAAAAAASTVPVAPLPSGYGFGAQSRMSSGGARGLYPAASFFVGNDSRSPVYSSRYITIAIGAGVVAHHDAQLGTVSRGRIPVA
jgi:RHS repeat-associated protein